MQDINFFNKSSRSPEDVLRQKDSSNSEDAFFEAYNLALLQKNDLFLSKLFKPVKLENTEVSLNIFTTTVSSNEESMNKSEGMYLIF